MGMLFQQFNRGRRAATVSLLQIRSVGGQPRKGRAKTRAGRDRKDLVLVVLVATARIDNLLPRLRVVQTAGADPAWHAVVDTAYRPGRHNSRACETTRAA